jgi:hypothetical protein
VADRSEGQAHALGQCGERHAAGVEPCALLSIDKIEKRYEGVGAWLSCTDSRTKRTPCPLCSAPNCQFGSIGCCPPAQADGQWGAAQGASRAVCRADWERTMQKSRPSDCVLRAG